MRDQTTRQGKQGFRECQAARRTIRGYEAIHMLRNGQARWISSDAVANRTSSSITRSSNCQMLWIGRS
jgi:hypothetical protein